MIGRGLGCLFVAGCTATAAAPAPGPATAPMSTPTPASALALAPVSAPAPAPASASVLAPAAAPVIAPTPLALSIAPPVSGDPLLGNVATTVDVAAWLAAHGMAPSSLGVPCYRAGMITCTCGSLKLPAPAPELLACYDGGMDQASSWDREILFAADGGRVRKVFDQAWHETDDPDMMVHGTVVWLHVLLHDGREIVVVDDDPRLGCAQGLAARAISPGYRALLQRMCAGRGRYVWRGQQLVREAADAK